MVGAIHRENLKAPGGWYDRAAHVTLMEPYEIAEDQIVYFKSQSQQPLTRLRVATQRLS